MEENILDDNYLEKDELTTARFWPRFRALLIDLVIFWVINVILDQIKPVFIAYNLFISYFLYLIYKPMFEFFFGATLGKMFVDIKVVCYDGNRVNFSNILLRNISGVLIILLKIFQSLPWFGDFLSKIIINFWVISNMNVSSFIILLILIVESIVFIFNENNQTLHDNLAKTLVVKK